jgi:large repetitive protein
MNRGWGGRTRRLASPAPAPGRRRRMRSTVDERGDTLLELVIALTIIAITVSALLGGLITVITSASTHRSLATLDSLLGSYAQGVEYQIQTQQPREDSVTLTKNSATVSDPAILSSDLGKPLATAGTTLTCTCYVGTVSSGSFTISSSPTNPGATETTGLPTSSGAATLGIGQSPLFANCAVPATSGVASPYTVASGPNPNVGPTGTTIVVFLSGFVPFAVSNAPVQVYFEQPSGSYTQAPITAQFPSGTLGDVPSNGQLTISFNAPSVASGSYPIVVTEATGSGTVIAAWTPGPFAVSSGQTANSTSVANDAMGVTNVQQWNAASQTFQSYSSSSSCPGASGIQLVTATASGVGATATTTFVVAGNATTTLIVTPAPSNPTLGQSGFSFTATIIPPSGTTPPPTKSSVVWDFSQSPGSPSCQGGNTTSVTQGQGNEGVSTCTIPSSQVEAGTWYVTATYNSDGKDPNYPEVTGNATTTVPHYTPTVTVSSSSNPYPGGSATLTATVTGTGSFQPGPGYVSWQITPPSGTATCPNSSVTGSGSDTATATCQLTSLKQGTYTVTATYNPQGDGNYNSAQSAATPVTVSQLTPTVAVTAPGPYAVNGTVTFTAIVSGPNGDPTPTGTVTWTITPPAGSGPAPTCSPNPGTLSGGSVSCSFSSAKFGTYTATAQYSGNTTYTSGSGSGTAVVKYNPTTSISSQLTRGALTFTATFTGQAGVQITAGTVNWTVSGGASSCDSMTSPTVSGNTVTATCTINNPSRRNQYNASATYSGDSNYNSATATQNGVQG